MSRKQILRRKRDRETFIFPVQMTTSRIGNLTRLIHTLLYVITIHVRTSLSCLSYAYMRRDGRPKTPGLTRYTLPPFSSSFSSIPLRVACKFVLLFVWSHNFHIFATVLFLFSCSPLCVRVFVLSSHLFWASDTMWTHQPGSHRKKATPYFSHPFPSSTVKSNFVYPR